MQSPAAGSACFMVSTATHKRVVSDLNLGGQRVPPLHLNCTGVCVVRAWPAAQNDEVFIGFNSIFGVKLPYSIWDLVGPLGPNAN